MSGAPPPRPKRSALSPAQPSPAAKEPMTSPEGPSSDSLKLTVELNLRVSDRWISAKASDGSKWYAGKPTNPNWTAVNATLRSMKPEVHEFDKRNERHSQLLQFYPSTFGNAREEWNFTCDPADFANGVYGRLASAHSDIIKTFKFTVTASGFEAPKSFKTIEDFVTAIKDIPEPKKNEPEDEEAEPGAIAAMHTEIRSLRDELLTVREELSAVIQRVSQLEIARE